MKPFRTIIVFIMAVALAYAAMCGASQTPSKSGSGTVGTIDGLQALTALIDTSGERLLMFDLYADWCLPCKLLSPLLETIAREQSARVSMYKIDIDKNPDIAAAFGVQGIPLVVFMKNRTGVQAFTGVQPKDTYVRAILRHGNGSVTEEKDKADGELVNGVRMIRITTATSPGDLFVYRGEEVTIVVEKVDFPYSIHLPAYAISQEAVIGKDLEVSFKAAETGVFPLFCNGKCPAGDGQRFGRIIVLDFEGSPGKGTFKGINVKKAREMMAGEKPFVLDVRTPQEYYEGYIPGAKLIPVGQLADRISEIAAYKNFPIIVYCRSGNRSIPASQILLRNGFKTVYNLRGGIRAWEKEGGPISR
jgi:thioredoxin